MYWLTTLWDSEKRKWNFSLIAFSSASLATSNGSITTIIYFSVPINWFRSVIIFFFAFFFAEFSRAHFYCQKYHSIVSKWVKLNEIEQGLSSERTNGFFAVKMKCGFNIDRESEMLISISIVFSMKSVTSQRHYKRTSTKLPTNPPPIKLTNCLQMHSHNTKIITIK